MDALPLISEIDGDLSISEHVAGLGHLGCLRKVTGSVSITLAQQLVSLDGLERLESIGGYLQIDDADLLANLALGGLRLVSGSISVTNNPSTDLTGLEGLTSVTGDLTLTGDIVLTSLAGLANVVTASSQAAYSQHYSARQFVGTVRPRGHAPPQRIEGRNKSYRRPAVARENNDGAVYDRQRRRESLLSHSCVIAAK